MQWLEISADYRCNSRCLGCFSVVDEAAPDPHMAASMSTAEALETLVWGRKNGARWLWLGGGDPTMRADLHVLVAQARRFGYERVKLETNAMRLADADYTRRLVAAGITEVNFAIKGATAESHDRLTRTPGGHALMVQAMAHVRAHGLSMEADVLVYRSNVNELPEVVRTYSALGVSRFHLWLLSAFDSAAPEVKAEVPRMTDVVPHVVAAVDLRLSDRPDFITSLHTPPCTVPESHHACLFDAKTLGLVVANPGRHRFPLEQSPIEGGLYAERCDGCRFRARCGGMRRDYVALHGDEEFQPPP